ncbi:MAG TPA: hypothetical protein VGP47_06975 [Parachlamydiaceae bacterium]|nr:hypothetical protein [Parachlamydiaceae bacterium]
MPYKLLQTLEYNEWIKKESPRSQVQINKRLSLIQFEECIGDQNLISLQEKSALKDKVWELHWKDGRCIYYACIPENRVLLLLGGNKNGQNKDVSKAKAIYFKVTESSSTKKGSEN